MAVIRWILGRLILTVDFLTRPRPVRRDVVAQDLVDASTARLALYQFKACPFCVKIRRLMRRHALHVELRDAKNDPAISAELVREGGMRKVPCLWRTLLVILRT